MRNVLCQELPFFLSLSVLLCAVTHAHKILISNDDGWAVAQIRVQYDTLKSANYDVILSAPAINGSGTGSLSEPLALPLLLPCEFDSCPPGSPGIGADESDPRLNYFNSFPVDAARYGIQNLSSTFFGTKPDLLVSGPNVGENAGLDIFISGTVGAACEGEREDVPSVAFSGISTRQVSYTTLKSDPLSPATLATYVYASLTTKFVQTLFASSSGIRLVPEGTIINVNYPALDFTEGSTCSKPEDIKWVFAKLSLLGSHPISLARDGGVGSCGKLPDGAAVVESDGCYASVVVLSAITKLNADKDAQAQVLKSLNGLGFTCFSG